MKRYFTYSNLSRAFLVLGAILVLSAANFTNVSAQQVANYGFTASSGTYTALSGPTNIFITGAWDDETPVSVPIGFSFTFNGVAYTSVFVHSNGFISFGTAATTSTYTPISGTFTAAGSVSAWGRDLQGQATAPIGSVDYLSTGGVFTVQWSNARRYNGTTANAEYINFQIKLVQTTNVIQIVYGSWTNAITAFSTSNGEVGLRGATNTDFKNLEVLTGGNWAAPTSGAVNTATCFFNESNVATKPATGQTYTFTPPLPCVTPANQPTALSLTPGATSIAGSFTAAASAPTNYLVVRTATNAAPTAPVDGTSYTAGASALGGLIISTGTGTTFTASGLTPTTQYFFWVYSFNSNGCSGGPLYLAASPLSANTTTTACSISGTKTVGPTGNYATLTAAFADLQNNGVAAPVILELQSTYVSTAEPAFPVVVPVIPCISAVNNVTVRPQAGATNLSITSASATGTLNFDAGDFVTFDGRAGGAGASQLTISNTSTTGYAVQLINSATFNTIKYCTVAGVNTGTASGVIVFNTATSFTTGNSNNTIDNCDIRDGATTPLNLIFATGTTTNGYGNQNNNNTISNSTLHDWFSATSTTAGAAINITAACSDWTITGNSFYQTVARTFTLTTATDQGAIFVASTIFGQNFTITNNFIGGSAPSCGGAPWTWTGGATGTPTPRLIRFSVGNGFPLSNISNNTIANLAITTSSTSTSSSLISHLNGNVNISNNTLGSQTATGNITFTLASTSTAPFFLAISMGTGANASTINVTNNNIGGITVGTNSTGAVSFRVIYGQPVAGSAVTISNNLVGGTVANSIQQLTGTAGAGVGSLFGILMLNPTLGNVITNNVIRNLNITTTFAGPSLTGVNIQSSGGGHTITGNTVTNLSTNSLNVAINNGASIVGITMTASAVGGTNVSNNTVFNLVNTNTTVAGWINGIYFGTALTPAPNTTISRNFVHSINVTSAIAGAGMAGIFLPNTGNGLVYNNTVRLGIDASGASLTNGLQINGMYKASSGSMGIYHNTVYVGGTGVASGAANTFAFRRIAAPTIGQDTVENNIFYNARSNASGTGKNYAVTQFANTTLLENFNVLLADGTGGFLGLFNATDCATLAAWQTASNTDWNSLASDPKLVNPTGSSATVDLHIQAAVVTPVEQGGINIPLVATDFDGQTRSGLTPVDIGADAGNFILADLTGPVITYPALLSSNCNTGDQSLNGVNITDATGIPTTGTLRPRIYYKKNAGAYFSQPGTLASGTATNSNWNFTIVAADLGGLVATDVVSYYVIAQDVVATPNISSNPAGVIATDVNTVTTHPVTPNTYTVSSAASLSGSYTVGVGGTYPTLTAAVAAYNTGCIGGPVTFNLIDANYAGETFPITINANAYASATNTLTIKATQANTTISGTSATAMIVLNGADWVTIDGSTSNTPNTVCPASAASRNLTITNTNASTASAVIWLQSIAPVNGATNNTIKNTNLVGSGNAQTFAGVGSGSSTISIATLGIANNNNAYINNSISKTQYGIVTQGTSIAIKNNGTVINQNLINTVAPDNVRRAGVYAGFENNITISGNNISEIASATSLEDVFGISLGSVTISTTTFTGNEVTNATITRNVIGTVRQTGTYSACGLFVAPAISGTNLIANNTLSGVSSNGTGGDWTSGIFIGGGNSSTTQLYYNTINMNSTIANTGSTDKSMALAIAGVNPVVDIRNNILYNNQNNGSGNNYAIVYGYTPFTNVTSNNNDYSVGSGATFFIGGVGSISAPVSLLTVANLQAFTGKDGAAQNVAPVFVSSTDMHLVAANPANAALICAGTPIASVATDIDCAARGAVVTTIGADEVVSPLSVTLARVENSGVAPNDGIICTGASVDINSTVLNGTAPTYLWSTAATTANLTGLTPAGSTNYTVTVTNLGCTATASTSVTVNPLPTVTISVTETSGTTNNDGIICVGAAAQLTATGGGTYSWSVGGFTTASIAVLPPITTTYTVTVTNANGCTATATTTITVNPLPTPSISIVESSGNVFNNDTICAGSPATLTANGGTTFAWSTGLNTASITVSPANTTTYTVTVTNANGCSAVTSRTINVVAVPTVSASVTEPTTCASTDGAITLTSNGSVYDWADLPGTNNPQNRTGLSVGVYTVTVTNGSNCSTSTSVALNGPGGCVCPTIGTLTASSPTCTNGSITFSVVNLTGMGNTYGIQFVQFPAATATPYVGGTVLATVPNASLGGAGTTASATVTIAASGSYVIYAIVTPLPLSPGCRPSSNVNITVSAPPTAGITETDNSGLVNNDNIICAGATATLTGTGGGTYAWNTGAATAAINVTTAGTYTVTVTSAAGCTASATITITVNPIPTPAISVAETSGVANNDGIICAGASAILTASGGGTYSWSTGVTTASITVTPAGTTTYTVTVTNANGCTATATSTITVNPLPTAAIAVAETSGTTANDGIICTGATATLTASGGGTYVWSTTATTAAISVTTAGTYTVTVTLNGCTSTATRTITVNPLPTPAIAVSETSGVANNDGIICGGATVTLTASGGTSYSWSTGAATAAISVTPAITTTYTVTVTNANGCTATSASTVTVNPLPTAFAVTGGGARCTTDGGLPVGLSGSQIGVSYQLQFNAVNQGAPLAGTGNALAFPTQTVAGTYTVVASANSCTSNMTGNAVITIFNCSGAISDPCVCLNNATTLTNGQFGEQIKVNAPSTQVWTVTAVTGLYQTASPAPPSAPNPITVGTVLTNIGGNMFTLDGRHIDAIGYTISVSNGAGTTLSIGNACQYPNPSITTDLTPAFCVNTDPITLVGNPGDNNIVSQGFTVNGVAATQFNPGAGVGQYTIVYTVNGGTPKASGPNDPGCIQSVSQIVSVIATPSQIACNDLVQVSLDEDCATEVLPDMILEGTYGCFDDYTVKITGINGLPNYGNIVTGANIGQTLKVTITHLVSGNTCWGLIKVEDKLPPVVTCKTIEIACAETNYDASYLANTLGIADAYPTVTENCTTYTQSYTDEWHDLPCPSTPTAGNITAYITRTWVVKDASNNSATCVQTINIIGSRVYDVNFPADAVIPCGAGVNTNPSNTGTPYITFDYPGGDRDYPIWPGSNYCELQATYVDQILPVCDGTYKILRTWTVYDWCVPTSPFPPTNNPQYYVQVVKVVDENGPSFTCPQDMTVSTDAFNCCASPNLPEVVMSDGCSRINHVSARILVYDQYTGALTNTLDIPGYLTSFPGNNLWNPDTLANFDITPCLPIGTHTVIYSATDDCGNHSTCSFDLTVEDLTPPTAVCDEWTKVALGVDGMAFVNAETFDDGSYDNCSQVYFKVRRMDANACQPNGSFLPQVKFCCSDIGDTVRVILRVYDVNAGTGNVGLEDFEGHYNDCMVQALVEDKIKPVCTAPANVTVSCESFDPSYWAYGQATAADNCCVDTIKQTVVLTNFDSLCNKGTITRRWTALDCAGNSSQCSQRIIVTYNQNYYVKFPADKLISTCDGTGNYGAPEFYGEDCELLATSFVDEIFTVVPDACFKIERTWTVINWCTYNPNAGCTYVPNPNPSNTTNAPANLAGVTVSAPGTTILNWNPTVVKINPTDPTATNYSTFWSQNANCYQYKQIIKVFDTQDPSVVTPTSGEYCDFSNNDAQFWNDSYWWDATIQSHDLCEGDADIAITATDACSGANISFRYLLFLDLDGNGTMETVVNSVNPPGFNNVFFNNAGNPNYGGGEPRQFDFRPVTQNQKWGFGLQTDAAAGNNRTAHVRWFNQQGQNAVPQLPYGTHKIKWFVEDGCGNEYISEQTLVVKDCKKPTVVCLNGLSVNLMNIQGGMVQLWASDFLQYTSDNCTPADQLKIGIRRSGTGTGFPTNPDGTAQTGVSFTCADLGTQLVELWSIDKAGNADFCETYVLIQDNMGVCGNGTTATVSGALKTDLAQEGVESATVELNGTTPAGLPVFGTVFTPAAGNYLFSNALPIAATATVTPTLELDPLNGVNTYDLILISRHILGLEPLSTPYKLIAADANKSGTVTTFDVVELRKLILGTYTELPGNSSWRFVDKSQNFANPANPFAETIRENLSIASIQSSVNNGDFVGVKVGDVDETATPNNLVSTDDRTTGTLLFDVEDRMVKAGEQFAVTFKAADKAQGYQFTMNLNNLEVMNIVPGTKMTIDNFAIFADAITTSADGSDGEFTVNFRATAAGQLSKMIGVSSRITKAVAFDATASKLDIGLRFNGKGTSTITGLGFELYQNVPNPWVSKTQIGFHLPEATTATLTIYDVTGRTLYTTKGNFAKGYNYFSIDRKLVESVGNLFYKVETSTDSGVKQMIEMK